MTPPNPTTDVQNKFKSLLSQCRDITLVSTNGQLTELIANSDMALMDFADKAESNLVQARFFEAISELKRKRLDVEHVFRERVAMPFNRFGQGTASGSQGNGGYLAEELSLVGEEDMNESVALENLVSRVHSNNAQRLYALGQRLAILNRGKKLSDEETPAGPHALAYAFQAALRQLDTDSRVRIVFYALFDKFVMREIGELYDELNSTLQNAGILPNLRPVAEKQSASARKAQEKSKDPQGEKSAEGTEGQSGGAGLGAELFESILDLMAAKRKRSGSSHREPENPIPKKALVSTIHDVCPPPATQFAGSDGEDALIPDIRIDQAFLDNVRQTLALDRERIFDQVGRENVSSVDADTIDLVGMLFEYMLNDPVLPNVAKALISHLHTPYLKVAIIDKELLTNNMHPARQLLDLMVDSGGYWVDESDLSLGIFPHMRTAVDRILKDFTDNVTLFDDLLEWFRDKVEESKRSSQIIEQRTQEATKGREKLALAKQRAFQEIKVRSSQWPLPQRVREFLNKTWVDKLIFVLLRHAEGEFSTDWHDALRVADELVWAFDPNATESDRRELAAALPRLRQTVEAGLRTLGDHSTAKVERLFELVENPDLNWRAMEQEEALLGVEAAAADVDTNEQTDKVAPESERPPSPAQRELMTKLRKLGPGAWFDLTVPGYESRHMVKMSWISEDTSNCLFVDRSGVLKAIIPLAEVAEKVLSKDIKVIRKAKKPFMERTLVSIRNMLTRSPKDGDDNGEDLGSLIPA